MLKLLNGEKTINYTGTISIGSGLIISYIPQDTSHLEGKLADFAKKYHIRESLFKIILRKLDFERSQFEKNIKDFSDGRKKKVSIAKSLCEQAQLYVWDEPLNYIDMYSRMQIEQMIQECSPTMLLVDHDLSFQKAIATKIIKFDE